MCAYLLNQTNPGNEQFFFLKSHFPVNNTQEGRQLPRVKVYPSLGNRTEKRI